MLTPQDIQDLADPIEEVYIHIVDELMVNIGKHIRKPNWTHTADYEIRKLSELGQLTKENAAIINKWIAEIPQDVRDAMEATRKKALEDIEKQMAAAAAAGYVTPPMRDSTVDVLRDYSQQATDKLNLVNTTMLQSSLTQFVRGVMITQEQMDAAQKILNETTGQVAIGAETRHNAVRYAIGKLAAEGLTGFVDKAGRQWSPEAYVNMDVRTTVHNVAIQSSKAFSGDYGVDVFQYSSHAAARPLCYPIQGKFFSWTDTAPGSVTLGNGKTVDYVPFNDKYVEGYGTGAGPFGCNCMHYPIPVIPGVTIPHGADNIQDEEANAKAYAESQKQRALERQIRAAKRVVAMAGDAATDEDRAKVREAQKQMRDFINETGRTRRYDREQIGGQPRPRKPAQNVASQATAPKIPEVKIADSDISAIMDKAGIKYNPVKYRKEQLDEQGIITVLSGGDRTRGSCASVGLAYCGQKSGLDVLDFRGGASQEYFSHDLVLRRLKDIPGIVWDEQPGHYCITTGNQLLKRVETGKQYWFSCGRHAAVVRRTEEGRLQYLELQSQLKSGWQDFNGNARYTLNTRFGAPTTRFGDAMSYMFEVDSVKDSPEFAKILGYINTAEEEQQKGRGGTIK